MDIHKNARLTLISREELAKRVSQQGWTLKAAAAAFNVSAKTAAKWVGRYRELGRQGLGDRSSRPQRSPCRTGADRVAQVEALRRERWTGLRIALTTGLSRATISRILRRLHLSRMRDLEPAPPVIRYEHAAPGDLLHLDIKKIGRRWFQVAHAAQVQPSQDAADGSAAQPGGQRDAQAGPALPPQRLDLRHPIGAGAARRALRSRRAVPQALAPQFAVAPHPLGRGFRTDVEGGGRRLQRPSLLAHSFR